MDKKSNKKNQKQNEKRKQQDKKGSEPDNKGKKPNLGHKSRVPDKLAEAKAKGMVSCICLYNKNASHGLIKLAPRLGYSLPRNS